MLNKKIFYILPCYNEELNLNKLLNDFNNFFKNKDFSIQIIIVDDGSKDNSLRVIKKFKKNKYSKKIKITVLISYNNMFRYNFVNISQNY